ncbi:MAG: molybdenum cofactor biosynthesis protein [Deltaproteobacteria bacterium]|nr:molybdenum cofactor biosynthesis protein [Deltaproteobacteria bacterium]
MGRVEAVCVSTTKGQKKSPRPEARFVANHGIEGDAHAGPSHRQLSLLDAGDIEAVRTGALPDLKSGDFAENLILSGIDLGALGLGSSLRLGSEVELSVTQIGKDCHQRCAIYEQTGDCIMPRLGVFARVLGGGTVKAGDAVRVLQVVPREEFQAVVLTISDRCSRGETADTAGPAVGRLLERSLPAHVYAGEIIPDERDQIAARLKHYSDGHSIDLVLAVGGTGFAPRDVTPEAVAAVIERPAPGLDEAMRRASIEKTPAAMLSRGVSGIRKRTLIISLPGSERGAVENLEAILPALGHGLAKLRGDPSDCGAGR